MSETPKEMKDSNSKEKIKEVVEASKKSTTTSTPKKELPENQEKGEVTLEKVVPKEEKTKEEKPKEEKPKEEVTKEVAIKEEVSLTKQELETLDYTNFDTPARMLELGKVLVKSSLVPLKNPSDVVSALLTGKQLGLPFMTSVSQIYPINGRATIGVHIQKALLLTAGIIFEKIEDAVAIFNFAKIDKEGKVLVEKKQVKDKVIQVPIIVAKGTLEEQPENTLKQQIDTRTTYKFTRQLKMANGEYKEMIAKSSFTLSEATEAELVTKDVWKKYWRRMLDARAFSIGAREIADDVLLGLYSPSELSNDFYVDKEGKEVPYIEAEIVS